MIFKKTILPIFLAMMWISISEFVRNQFVLLNYWQDHYTAMGQEFPAQPINGAVWGIWALTFAIVIFIISKKFELRSTIILSWIVGFVMMWLVIGNLGVLPFEILRYAIPLSIIETGLAAIIIKKLS